MTNRQGCVNRVNTGPGCFSRMKGNLYHLKTQTLVMIHYAGIFLDVIINKIYKRN